MVVHLQVLQRQRASQANALPNMQEANVLILPTRMHIEMLKAQGYRLVHRPSNIVQLRANKNELTGPEAA